LVLVVVVVVVVVSHVACGDVAIQILNSKKMLLLADSPSQAETTDGGFGKW
jgi:hypothetical protein